VFIKQTQNKCWRDVTGTVVLFKNTYLVQLLATFNLTIVSYHVKNKSRTVFSGSCYKNDVDKQSSLNRN